MTIDENTYDQLRYAQALSSHRIPSGDLAPVLARLVELGVAQLEKQKFAVTEHPREGGETPPAGTRHVPATVTRAVWERDGGQCTYMSEAGQRCPARTQIEFDHLDPVCLGGRASVDGIALECRAHKMEAAERLLGRDFMKRKLEITRAATGPRQATARAPSTGGVSSG